MIFGEKNTSPSLKFVSDDGGVKLSRDMCIFYNNFEVASFSLFRNSTYLSYFDYLDRKGGIYYERWGDAPIRTYYIAWMLDRKLVHMFEDVPYFHVLYNFKIWDGQCQEMILPECNERWIKTAS